MPNPIKRPRRRFAALVALAAVLASLTACESIRGFGNSDGGGGVRGGGLFRF